MLFCKVNGTKLLSNEDDQNKAKDGEQNLAHLMRIAIEMPEKLPDDIVVAIWNRKTRHIAALILCYNKIGILAIL